MSEPAWSIKYILPADSEVKAVAQLANLRLRIISALIHGVDHMIKVHWLEKALVL